MWIRVVASVRALLPCTLHLGKEMIINHRIESHDIPWYVDFYLWITPWWCKYTFFQNWEQCVRNCRPVYNKFGVVQFLLRFFSPTHLANIIWFSERLPFLVCGLVVSLALQDESSSFCHAAAGCCFSNPESAIQFKTADGTMAFSRIWHEEPWHADVYDFLELRKNHGKEEQRARCFAMVLTDKRCDVGVSVGDEKATWWRYSSCRYLKVSFLQWVLICFFSREIEPTNATLDIVIRSEGGNFPDVGLDLLSLLFWKSPEKHTQMV